MSRRRTALKIGRVAGPWFLRMAWWLLRRRLRRSSNARNQRHYDYEVKR